MKAINELLKRASMIVGNSKYGITENSIIDFADSIGKKNTAEQILNIDVKETPQKQ